MRRVTSNAFGMAFMDIERAQNLEALKWLLEQR